MADPITMMAVAGGISAVGSIAQGQASARAAEFNARISSANARLAEQRGDTQARLIRRQGRQALGRQRAAAAASGVAMEGSILDIMADSRYQIERDALTAKFNAGVEARGQQMQASVQRTQGRQAQVAGFMRAGTELLSTGSEIQDMG